MTVSDWLAMAIAHADRKGLPQLKATLEALGKATESLRAADWNDDATGPRSQRR